MPLILEFSNTIPAVKSLICCETGYQTHVTVIGNDLAIRLKIKGEVITGGTPTEATR